ncbi:hypothetical protein OH807_00845 [Kitasatospora sp. NBC_01560]|uniref:hypothetical protein n=1 Tax=Kitasatospora sp. NBC_01560 TaxID=2975965 RepID=UPI0038699D23
MVVTGVVGDHEAAQVEAVAGGRGKAEAGEAHGGGPGVVVRGGGAGGLQEPPL